MIDMQTWTLDDFRPPAGGPWDDEPDKAVWVDPTTDLDCMVHRNFSGALCGYVGVPTGHPYHGVRFTQIDVQVHGGLTYSDPCQEDAEGDAGICHVPLPGRDPHVWWLGFDCHHGFDLGPTFEARMRELHASHPQLGGYRERGDFLTYRTFAYVKAEVEFLAQQCAEAAP